MRTTVIIKTDPVADDVCGVLYALEAVTVGALFF
jgi:inosine-uridine nucleoside N-ribohydrolase